MSQPERPALFNITAGDFQQIVEYLKRDLTQLLHIPNVRLQIALARVKATKREDIRTLDDSVSPAIDNTVEHNLRGLISGSALERPRRLLYPLMGVFDLMRRAGSSKVLSVGPRSENELFLLVTLGFKPENITGLDLISYSPLVKLGDMHEMPFEADSFDVIVLGWVLAYSNDVAKAVAETVRVAKPGAYVAVGWEYNPRTDEELAEKGSIVSGGRVNYADEIVDLFGKHVDRVIFRTDPLPESRGETGDVIAIFRLKA